MVNLERSNTVKTHKKRARKIVRRPVQALPASNEPPGPLQDKPVWGINLIIESRLLGVLCNVGLSLLFGVNDDI